MIAMNSNKGHVMKVQNNIKMNVYLFMLAIQYILFTFFYLCISALQNLNICCTNIYCAALLQNQCRSNFPSQDFRTVKEVNSVLQ